MTDEIEYKNIDIQTLKRRMKILGVSLEELSRDTGIPIERLKEMLD